MSSRFLNTEDRFGKNKTTTPYDNGEKPIPTRNIYALFGDGGHDLFRHGLADLTVLPTGDPNNTRLSLFTETPDYFIKTDGFGDVTAKEDPVMFGFDIIIRTQESPLFSSTIPDSVQSLFASDIVNGNDEMKSREEIWKVFKTQFFQFFRDTLEHHPYTESPNTDNPSNSRFYYYLKKVSGLENLVESNSGENIKAFTDYGKDMIKLEFSEDVSLRLGRLAQLYKTLYWSRLGGKTMIPENLLRFDCDIVVSEVRNFVKVKKALDNPNDIQVLRDNVNRYVYTLYDCQLFFDKMAHPGEIDLGSAPTEFNGYGVSFNYKFSTVRVDAFDVQSDTTYTSVNTGTYNPYSVTPLDRFLNTTSDIASSTQSSIGVTKAGSIADVVIEVIPYNEDNSVPNKQNKDTNSDSKADTTKSSNINNAKLNSQIDDAIVSQKKSLLDEEIKQFKDSTNFNKPLLIGPEASPTVTPLSPIKPTPVTPSVTDHRWGRPSILVGGDHDGYGGADQNYQQAGFTTNQFGEHTANKKDKMSSKETTDSKDGKSKNSWLNGDTPGAKFAKRIANAGISAVNSAILSRAAILNKTLDKITGNLPVGPHSITPPLNLYTNTFNGQIASSSKQVRDAFTKFAGESIADLFKKK